MTQVVFLLFFYRNSDEHILVCFVESRVVFALRNPFLLKCWKFQKKWQIASLPVRLQGFGLSHKQRLKQDRDSCAWDWRAFGFCSDPSPEAASDTGVGQMQFEGDKKKEKKGKFPISWSISFTWMLRQVSFTVQDTSCGVFFKYSEIINNNSNKNKNI